MKNFISQYNELERNIKNFLTDFIEKNGVTVDDIDGKVIPINVRYFQKNISLGQVRDYEFMDSNLNLYLCGHPYGFRTFDFEEIAEFCDAVQRDWKREELILVTGENEMVHSDSREYFYPSLERAFEAIKDGTFETYEDLRIQKWVGDDWVDFIPTKIEIYNRVENKNVYYGEAEAGIIYMVFIIKDNDKAHGYDADNELLECRDATILMHHIHRFIDDYVITYLN